MSRSFYISILLLVCIFPAPGQLSVIDASSLTGKFSCRFLPDVEGKVVIDATCFNYLPIKEINDDVTVFPGWPVSFPGSNERGGVYANLDDDPEFELVYPIGSVLHALNIDGSNVAGWPKALDYPTDGAASFGDIDGDGVGEIVVTTHQTATFAFGTIYAFETDGSDADGFPVATEGGGVRTPVLADLIGDDALEIIIAVRDWPEGFIYVYNGDGTIYPNWPQRMDYVPGSAVAVGDIYDDDIPEIIAESYYFLHAFTADGILMEGFPYSPGPGRVFSYSTPVLADLDGDGNREIICGDHSINDGSGAIHIVRHDGTIPDGWPKITGSWIYGPPSVGDIDGDGLLDIAVGDQAISETPINKVYAWTGTTGDVLAGFPILNVFGVNSQIILADIDGDEKIELMFDDNTAFNSFGQYPGYNHDGTPMEDWPLVTDGSTFFIDPLLFDVNLDGILDISGGGFNPGTGNTNVYLWSADVEFNREMAVLHTLQYNTRHNGVYGDYLMVGTPEIPGIDKEGLSIFPNPAREILNFKFSMLNSGNISSVGIYDISGKEVMEIMVPDGQDELRLSIKDFDQGIYTVVLKEGNSVSLSGKFVIHR